METAQELSGLLAQLQQVRVHRLVRVCTNPTPRGLDREIDKPVLLSLVTSLHTRLEDCAELPTTVPPQLAPQLATLTPVSSLDCATLLELSPTTAAVSMLLPVGRLSHFGRTVPCIGSL